MSLKRRAKRRKVVSHCHSRVFCIKFPFSPAKGERNKDAINEFIKEELVNILRRLYVKTRSHDGKCSYSVVIQWEQVELVWIAQTSV